MSVITRRARVGAESSLACSDRPSTETHPIQYNQAYNSPGRFLPVCQRWRGRPVIFTAPLHSHTHKQRFPLLLAGIGNYSLWLVLGARPAFLLASAVLTAKAAHKSNSPALTDLWRCGCALIIAWPKSSLSLSARSPTSLCQSEGKSLFPPLHSPPCFLRLPRLRICWSGCARPHSRAIYDLLITRNYARAEPHAPRGWFMWRLQITFLSSSPLLIRASEREMHSIIKN